MSRRWKTLTLVLVVILVSLCIGNYVWPGWAYGRPSWEGWFSPRGGQAALATSGTIYETDTGTSTDTDTDTTTTTGDTGQDAQAAIGTDCRDPRWLAAALSNTKEVSELLAVLDRDFTLVDGGQWSETNYTVPAGTVFWTDLYENRFSLPQGVSPLRIKGGWGIYLTTNPFNVPPPNYGGRWTRLCGPLAGVTAEIEGPSEGPAAVTTDECLIPDLDGMTVRQAIDVMDDWFDGVAYQWGDSFASGDNIPSGSVFWTDLGEGSRPSSVTCVSCEGNWGVFTTSQALTVASQGRYVNCN